MKQYVYSYETIQSGLDGWGAFGGNVYAIEDFRPIIRRKAAEGWRYVGFIPTKQRGTGHIEEMDLIFEKETDNT